jgi:hypothetical protein
LALLLIELSTLSAVAVIMEVEEEDVGSVGVMLGSYPFKKKLD